MATKVVMEALSPTMEEGRLVKWLKNEGDQVKNGETLAEVETDKAIMELVARGDGVLRARLAEEGATSPIGAVIGVIAAADPRFLPVPVDLPPAPADRQRRRGVSVLALAAAAVIGLVLGRLSKRDDV